MAFTYDATQLTESLNRLRFLVQDTEDSGHLFEDDEINFIASNNSNIQRAAAHLCRVKAAKFATMPNIDDEAIKFDSQARAREMRLLADEYEKQAVRLDNVPDAADSIDTNFTLFESGDSLTGDDNYPSAFTRGLHFSR